jgi:hypothetical protein
MSEIDVLDALTSLKMYVLDARRVHYKIRVNLFRIPEYNFFGENISVLNSEIDSNKYGYIQTCRNIIENHSNIPEFDDNVRNMIRSVCEIAEKTDWKDPDQIIKVYSHHEELMKNKFLNNDNVH